MENSDRPCKSEDFQVGQDGVLTVFTNEGCQILADVLGVAVDKQITLGRGRTFVPKPMTVAEHVGQVMDGYDVNPKRRTWIRRIVAFAIGSIAIMTVWVWSKIK